MDEWTQQQIKILKSQFPGRPTAEIADLVGRSVEATKRKAARLGLKKSRKYLKSLNRS
jgi:DNA-binding Lrp family transcriptional regulator